MNLRPLRRSLPLVALLAIPATPWLARAEHRVVTIERDPDVIVVRRDGAWSDRYDVEVHRWARRVAARARADAARARADARRARRDLRIRDAREMRNLAQRIREQVRDQVRDELRGDHLWRERDARRRVLDDDLRIRLRDRLRDIGRIRVRGPREWSI